MKEDAPPVLAPKPEKLPNFWGTPGCWWYCFNVSEWSGGKKRVGTYSGAWRRWRAYECNGRASSLGKTPYPTRTVRKFNSKKARRPAMKERTPAFPTLTPWLLGNLFELPVEIIR